MSLLNADAVIAAGVIGSRGMGCPITMCNTGFSVTGVGVAPTRAFCSQAVRCLVRRLWLSTLTI